jgi:hypothetical protein
VTPIFVGGSPRSGTTLLGSMLGAHDRVVCLPESPVIGRLANVDRCRRADRTTAQDVHRAIQADFQFAFWKLSPEDVNACAQMAATSYRELIDAYAACFARRNGRSAATHWIDHSPTNLMYSARLHAQFPEAKFIHLVRDGRAVCASWMPLNWGPNTIIPAAHTWAMHVGYGLAAEAALPAAVVRRVTYEELVTEPKKVLRRLCQWIDLPYQANLVTGSGLEVPVYTRNQHTLIGRPVDSKRIADWRTKLSARDIELFEYATGDLLVHLGYELEGPGHCAEPSNFEKLWMELIERTRQLAHLATRPIRLRRFLRSLKREKRTQECIAPMIAESTAAGPQARITGDDLRM